MESVINEIYQLLKDNNFEVISSINVTLKCNICNKILNNARSSPCGCRYCFDCISTYLNGTQKTCPGSGEDCITAQVCIDNVGIDHFANREVSRLIVKCPYRNCVFEDELKNIAVHMRSCSLNLINCPYFNFGCKDFDAANKTVKDHLYQEIVSHTELLINFLNNLTNENGILLSYKIENQTLTTELQRKNELNTEEIEELNEEIMALKNSYRSLNEEFQNYKSDQFVENLKAKILNMGKKSEMQIIEIGEINKTLQQIQNNQNSIKNLENVENLNKKEIEKLSNEMVAMKNLMESLNKEFKNLKINKSFENIETKLTMFENKSDIQSRELTTIKQKLEQTEKNHKEINKSIDNILNNNLTTVKKSNDQFELISKSIEEMKNNFQKKFVEMEIHIQTKYIFGEFIWNVKKFSKIKTETEMNIFSDEFFSHRNGYKMCLSLNSNGFSDGGWNEFCSIYLHFMKSKNDDNLSWPCKLNFNIELLNQKNRENCNRKTLKFIDRPKHNGWNKPTTQRNIGLGFTNFILMKDLLENPLLYQDDQIFIRCSVEIQT